MVCTCTSIFEIHIWSTIGLRLTHYSKFLVASSNFRLQEVISQWIQNTNRNEISPEHTNQEF